MVALHISFIILFQLIKVKLINQAINGSFTYQLHHIIPINQGGSVYSVDNLVVVTPRYHAEILIPEVHGYNGFKQFFR